MEFLVLLSALICTSCALRFAMIGDTGGLPLVGTTVAQRAVTRSLEQFAGGGPGLDAVLNLGDNIYFTGASSVDDRRFQTSFEDPYGHPSLKVPWLMTAGNHDHYGNIQAEVDYTARSQKWFMPSLYYLRRFSSPTDGATADFLFIDTVVACGNTRDLQSANFAQFLTSTIMGGDLVPQGPSNKTAADIQWSWLDGQMRTSRADYLFVAGHYPVLSVAAQGNIQCLFDNLRPLLYKYNATAYLSGHDHTLQHIQQYQGGQQMDYIISGAGSRVESGTMNIGYVEAVADVKYHYPENTNLFDLLGLSALSMLGLSDGGFIMIDVDKTSAKFDFRDLNGNQKYVTVLQPRVFS